MIWYVVFAGPGPSALELVLRNDVGDVIQDVNLSDENAVIGCIEKFLRDAGYTPQRADQAPPPAELAYWTLS
jgi:hypothetical protein